MRGALDARGVHGVLVGIIPAYAGSTDHERGAYRRAGDHPRICGEHHVVTVVAERHEGIIPAYAGSTQDSPWHDSLDGDHPRICGEHPAYRRPKP